MRDPRIDFFRGLAIYMIFVDHVSDDPLAKLTYHMLGFSDAAEIFVFISGFVCGIAYSRVLARQGLSVLLAAIAKRATRIYFYYAWSSVMIILLVAAAVKYRGLQATFGIDAEQPAGAIASALLFIAPPELSGILALYLLVTFIVVPTFLLAHDRYWAFALAVSGLLWVISQFLAEYMAPLTHRLFLNPLAWQFLFAIGVTLGISRERRSPAASLRPSSFRLLVIAAWVVVLGSLAIRILAARSAFNVEALRLDPATALAMKENLSPIRLLHFLSMVVLVAIYFRQDSAILNWPIFKPVIDTGAHSLEVFSLSVVLTVVANILVSTTTPSLGDRLAIDCVAFLVLALSATALSHRRAFLRRQPG